MPELVNDFGAAVYNFDGDPCLECELDQRFFVLSMRVMLPDGSTHELRRSDTVYTSSNRPTDLGTYVAVDGSRMRYVEGPNVTGTLYLPDGSRYLMGNQVNKYIDPNGNTLTYNSDGRWTDTLGRTVGLELTNNPATPTSDQVYTLKGFNGASRNYTFRYKYLSDARGVTAVNTTGDMNVFGPGTYPGMFHSDGGTRVTPPAQFNPAVLTEIELPNGTKYKFSYNEFGEVDKVIFPTGGYERYLYAVIPGIDPVNEPYAQTNRGVTDRRVSPSGTGNDELHTHYEVSTSPDYKVTVTDPDNTYTERRLLRGRGPGVIDFGFDDSRAGMVYDERAYSPSGQMFRRKLTEWSQSGTQSSGSLSATATRDSRVTKEVEILLDTSGGNALATTTTYHYDADLNITSTTEYDALGRVTKVTTPDGARVRTAYSGVQVLVTDQANRQRLSKSDALGRLMDLWEIMAADPQNPDPGLEAVSFPTPADVPTVGTGYRTSYTYDWLNRNTLVTYTRPAGSSVDPTPDVKHYYDSNGIGLNGLGQLYFDTGGGGLGFLLRQVR